MLFFIVGVSSLSTIGIYSYLHAKDALLKRTLEQLTSIRVIKKRQIEIYFQERFNNLELLADNDFINNLAIKISSEGESLQVKTSDKYPDYSLFGLNNMYLITGEEPSNLRIYEVANLKPVLFDRNSEIIQQLIELWEKSNKAVEPLIVDFKKQSINEIEPQCFIGKQISNTPPNEVCVLALPISIQDINGILLEDNPENGLGRSGEVYLVGDDYLMRSNSRFITNSVLSTEVKTISANNAFKDEVGSSLIDDYRSVPCLSSFERLNIPGLNWAIIAEIDYSEAMIPIVTIRNDIIFISIIICIFLFSIAHIISRTITKPIIKLKNVALKIGEGNMDFNLKPKMNDEIGLLYIAFNTMAEQLKDERSKRMTALYDGQELERQRISRELHDGLGQKLIAIKLQLESTSKQNIEETKATIEEVKANFLTTIGEVRQISNNLAPNILNDSGLDVALKNLYDSIKITSKIDIEFSADGDYFIANHKIKFYIYRIAQEALNNAVKHSGASRIQIQLIGNKENIVLVIEDNGKGFNYDNSICFPCNGIYNMKERAKLLNGSIDIETEPSMGTTIRLKVPKHHI